MDHLKPLLKFALVLWMTLLCATAAAQNDGGGEDLDAQINALEQNAKQAYDEGNYEEAIALITKANQLRPHPNYLINIAFTYVQMEDCTNAKIWAKNALSTEELDQNAQAAVQNIISECEEKERLAAENPPLTDPPPPAERNPVWLAAGIPLAVVGVGALTYLTIEDQRLLSEKQDLEDERDAVLASGDEDLIRDYNNRVVQAEKDEFSSGVEIAAFTVSGLMAAVGTGMIVYYFVSGEEANPSSTNKEDADKATSSWKLSPMVGPEATGLFLQGSF